MSKQINIDPKGAQSDKNFGGSGVKDKKIESFIDKLIQNGIIGEEQKTEARVILIWLKYGRKKAEMISKEMVQRLVNNGGTTDDGQKLIFTTPSKEFDFIFNILIAEGLIEKVGEKGE